MQLTLNDIRKNNVAGLHIHRDTVSPEKRLKTTEQLLIKDKMESMQLDSFAANTDFLLRFHDANKENILSRAISKVRYFDSRSSSFNRRIQVNVEKISKYTYQMHNKFALAIVCVIFLFIGAPMGAIVRKGGVGYPMLIAIIFFMLFIVITMFSKTMVDKAMMDPYLGAWLSCIVLFPIGVFLTIKARNDSKFISIDAIQAFFTRLFPAKSARNKGA